MQTLTRPEGTDPRDLTLSRRGLAGAFFGGYAVYALSAQAEPITTGAEGLITETVLLNASDRQIPAFVARPDARGRFPTVVVVSEVFGVHEYIRDVCRRLAKLGYAAIAPDFFIRAGDPAGISDFAEIRRIVSQASDQQVMGDLRAAVTFLGAQRYVDRKKLAITGFCWGGAVAWLACERMSDFKAGAAWYGRLAPPKPGEFLGEPERQWPIELVAQLRAPMIGFYAGKDQGIPLADVEAMRTALAQAGRAGNEIIVYPDSQHGFHADYRSSYDPNAAFDAWMRMLGHFSNNGVAPRTLRR